MKLISKDILGEYGFKAIESNKKIKGVFMERDKFAVALMDDGDCYYTNMGFDYPLRDLAALKKMYKEVRSKNLVPVE